MRKAYLAATLAIAMAVGAGTLSYAMLSGGKEQASAPAQVDDWSLQVASCVGPNPTEVSLTSDELYACVLDVMETAVDAGQIAQLQEVLAAQVQKTPLFYQACHTMGHKAGQYAYAKLGNAGQLIRDNPTTACEYGYGHGVLDGLSEAQPTKEQMKDAILACEEYLSGAREPRMAGGYCADGVGHAAWWSTKDLQKALDVCSLHELGDGKSTCMGGVMMELFEPVGFIDTSTPEYAVEQATDVIPGICQTVAQRSDPALNQGCARGAAYVFTRPAWRLAGGAVGQGEVPQAAIEAWNAAVSHCSLLGEYQGNCLDASLQQIPYDILRSEQALKIACQAFADAAHREECLKASINFK